MNMNQLKYVLTVANSSSLREAAMKLYISQPALSLSISELENELGIVLFERSNRGIGLTDAGREFITYAKKVLGQYEILEDRYLSRNKDKERFSVSTQHYNFAIRSFTNVIRRFGPGKYVFSIHETKTNEVLENVRDMKSEVGIVSYSGANEAVIRKLFKDFQLEFVPLMQRETYAYLWKEHPFADRREISLEELKDQRFIQNYQDEYISIENSAEENVLSWRELDVAVVTNSDYIMDKMLKSSDLVNLSGSYLSEDQAANYGKRLALPHNQIRFGYVMRKEEQLDEGVWELIQYLERQLRRRPQADDSAI